MTNFNLASDLALGWRLCLSPPWMTSGELWTKPVHPIAIPGTLSEVRDHCYPSGLPLNMGWDTVLQWIQLYLEISTAERELFYTLTYAVSQGSMLTPMLFNSYMKLLGEAVRQFGLKCHQDADDTQLYLSLSSDLKGGRSHPQLVHGSSNQTDEDQKAEA